MPRARTLSARSVQGYIGKVAKNLEGIVGSELATAYAAMAQLRWSETTQLFRQVAEDTYRFVGAIIHRGGKVSVSLDGDTVTTDGAGGEAATVRGGTVRYTVDVEPLTDEEGASRYKSVALAMAAMAYKFLRQKPKYDDHTVAALAWLYNTRFNVPLDRALEIAKLIVAAYLQYLSGTVAGAKGA